MREQGQHLEAQLSFGPSPENLKEFALLIPEGNRSKQVKPSGHRKGTDSQEKPETEQKPET